MHLDTSYDLPSPAIQQKDREKLQANVPVFRKNHGVKRAAPIGVPDTPKFVRLALSVEKLHQLLKRRDIRAVDFRCLDCETKDCVRKLLLDASTHFFE